MSIHIHTHSHPYTVDYMAPPTLLLVFFNKGGKWEYTVAGRRRHKSQKFTYRTFFFRYLIKYSLTTNPNLIFTSIILFIYYTLILLNLTKYSFFIK